MRERLKEPRKGSEIEPEIVCVQGVGAQHKVNLSFLIVKLEARKREKSSPSKCIPFARRDEKNRRFVSCRVTACFL